MKPVLAALVFSIVSAAIAAPVALACGPYAAEAAPVVREHATGQWPSITRADGVVQLELHYPRFEVSGQRLYMEHFVVVADRTLRRLERRLAGEVGWAIDVSVEEVAPGRWRVTGWRESPRAG